jgi:ankyrin repeat protein
MTRKRIMTIDPLVSRAIHFTTMKTKLTLLLAALISLHAQAADDLTAALQQALFHEEADHDLAAAIKAYQFVVAGADAQRKLAATAVFRLGECYRKLGQTNEAVAQYQRIVEQFTDQTNLVTLSRQNLAGLGAGPANVSPASTFQERLAGINSSVGASEEEKEIRRIQALIKDSPDLINHQSESDGTPLKMAAGRGQLAVATFLLDNKADPDLPDSNGTTPLIAAAVSGRKNLCELLLERGANPNSKNASGRSALHAASQNGFRAIVEVLLNAKADPNPRDTIAGTPLCDAVTKGFLSVAQLLLERGANPDLGRTALPNQSTPLDLERDYKSGTPLHFAVLRQSQPLTELLLRHKAKPDLRDRPGLSPLDLAASAGSTNLAQLLVQAGADLNAAGTESYAEGWTPLHRAVSARLPNMVSWLLARGANPNARMRTQYDNDSLRTALMLVVPQSDRPERELAVAIASSLLEAKADPNLKSARGYTALHLAVAQRQEALVEALLRHGSKVETLNPSEETSLGLAAGRIGSSRMVTLLLEAKADPNQRGGDGLTALHKAAGYQRKEILELLLAAGANPNLTDPQGRTPLDYVKQGVNYENRGGFGMVQSLPPTVAVGAPASPTPPLNAIQAEMTDALRKGGAAEWVPRPGQITVTRRSTGAIVVPFTKGTNDWNRHSLFEVFAFTFFGQNSPFIFPDFSKVLITRLDPKTGTTREFTVNLEAKAASGNCAEDVWLEWGDLIEIPEREHRLSEGWAGPSEELMRPIKQCIARKVTLKVKGQSKELPLEVASNWNQEPGTIAGGGSRLIPSTTFRLRQVVQRSGLLLTSSDTGRVKVKRTDASTGRIQEWLFDLSAAGSSEDLWLRDGDVIEVPEKDASRAAASPRAEVSAEAFSVQLNFDPIDVNQSAIIEAAPVQFQFTPLPSKE